MPLRCGVQVSSRQNWHFYLSGTDTLLIYPALSPLRMKQHRAGGFHIDDFFAEYSPFVYNRAAPVTREFYRMCDYFQWGKDEEERDGARQGFKDAMTLQFNSIYGVDVDDINSWTMLCQDLRIFPTPTDLETCRDVSIFTEFGH